MKNAERTLIGLSAIFLLINSSAYSLVKHGVLAWASLQPFCIWLIGCIVSHLLLNRYRPNRDPFLFAIYAMLSGWGLLLQERLAPNFIGRQTIWFILGTALLTAIAIAPSFIHPIRSYRYTLLLGGLLLVLLTMRFGVNPSGEGLPLWLPIPIIDAYFQPSEFLKLIFIFYFSSYFADRDRLLRVSQQKGLLHAVPYLAPLLLMWGFCLILLVWQKDLGSATIFFFLFIAMLYIATHQTRYLLLGLLLLLVASVMGYYAFDVVALRINAWWNPWPDYDNRAYQIVQSLYSIAAGGIFGSGIGQGYPTFIPVVHSDFVFVAIAEEWGLVGSFVIIASFAVLTQRGLRIAMQYRESFYLYLTTGMTLLLAIQAIMIMAGNAKLLPLTGVMLPFVSYGGSSMILGCVMLGILLQLSHTDSAEFVA